MAGFKRLFKRGQDTEGRRSSSRHQLVATLDFEEKHSRYALFFRDDPVKTQTNQGQNPENEEFISVKLPTYMLLTPNKKIDSFGYEAMKRYADLTKKDKHRGWMLFRGFNVLLQSKGLTRGSTFKDINGKSMLAMEIFSMSLGFLRDHMLQELRNQKVGVKEIDIQYEITVLACWDDNAKQFIMDTAVQAGLDSQRVKFSLDVPDSACQNIAWDLEERATNELKSSSSHLIVAAFDIGTTFSGYAFSFRDEPMKIKANHGWNSGNFISLKAPTCVLLTPNKQFHSFGFDAENKYADLAESNKHHGWMLFQRFKMLLHHNEGLTRESTVEDISGQPMRAMEIFSMSIGYLRDHLLQTVNSQTVGVKETDIQYVITVPAIWNDNAKQFMREAAVEAGLDSQRVKLSLEPEAASIWCQTVKTDATSSLSDSGCQNMVVDLGGGTADISVHEKNVDGTLKEIHQASGGPWGGTAVDTNYVGWLTKVFGQTTMNRFKQEQIADYIDIQRQFEVKKRLLSQDTQSKVSVRIYNSLKKIYKEIEGTDFNRKVNDMGLSDMVNFTGDKLRLDASIVRGWFEEPIQQTIKTKIISI